MITKTALKTSVLFIIFALLHFTGYSQKKDYQLEMQQLYTSIHTHFYKDSIAYYKENAVSEKRDRPVSYLWPLCALFEACNEMERNSSKKNITTQTFKIIKKYYNQLPPAAGYASYSIEKGGGSRFYDDNQWVGITAMDIYSQNKKKEWLNVSKEIYRFMMTGYDTITGGGLYWEEGNKKSKNTCSNGPGIILAMQLYHATNQQPYLDTAILLYNWTTKNLKSSTGLFFDNINTITKKIDTKQYAYNTGTMMQAALYLYESTNEIKYLNHAKEMAESSVNYFFADNKLKDSYWFSAVLLRGYFHLLKHDNDKKYINAFKTCVNNALDNNKNENGLMGKIRLQNLVNQSGMLEILARLANLEK